MNVMSAMVMEKPHYQMETHMKACMKMVNAMGKELTGMYISS